MSFRSNDDRRPSKFIVLADNMKSAINMAWEHRGADFQSRFDKSTGPSVTAIWESSPRTEDQDARAGDQWTVPEMWLSSCVGFGSGKNVGGARRKPFQCLVHPRSPKKKNRPEVIRTVSSILGDFCFGTFSAHRPVLPLKAPWRLLLGSRNPLGSLLMLETDDTERVLQSQIALFFQGLDLPGRHVFEKSTARFSKYLLFTDWPKDRLLCPKDRIYFSSAKD